MFIGFLVEFCANWQSLSSDYIKTPFCISKNVSVYLLATVSVDLPAVEVGLPSVRVGLPTVCLSWSANGLSAWSANCLSLSAKRLCCSANYLSLSTKCHLKLLENQVHEVTMLSTYLSRVLPCLLHIVHINLRHFLYGELLQPIKD